tara:strand:+ start:1528 stop:1962 length:435 start_codon:yes stop_codon:yes gene_type:complete
MTIKSRKRLHGKRRRKSSLKQRISDTNPYGNIPVPVITKPSTSTSTSNNAKVDIEKLKDFSKDQIKKQVVKKAVSRAPGIVKKYGGRIVNKLGGVASLMLDALPAGEGSTTMDYKYDDLFKNSESFQNKEIKDTLANIRKKNNN